MYKAYIETAIKNNAGFLFNETAATWDPTNEGVCVTTSRGKYYAKQLLLTAGAWLKDCLPDLNLPPTVE